ncbi:MAG: FdhF/YdeP family oxidoreductase [Pseudomonadota bacterium]
MSSGDKDHSGPEAPRVVGGGARKVLYTLKTAKGMGLLNAAKALNSKNACKACGYGMGGQRGGMTNEQGDFPAVCNKSVQAQSTDIQPPIPAAIFDHPLPELRDLDPHDLEHLGRLGMPIHKPADSDRYQPISWDAALDLTADRLAQVDPQRTFFYASGRSSNEAGFVFQLLARMYGTNHVNNCSFYCHQATGVGLGHTIGTGTATVELDDLDACDQIWVIGANPASNHPRFVHKLKALRERGGQVIVINPAREPGLVKFAVPRSPRSLLSGGSDIASHYLQPNIGQDVAVLKALCKAVLEEGGVDHPFIDQHCEGFAVFEADIREASWDKLVTASGLSADELKAIARVYMSGERVVFAWGMGVTHHLNGVENVEMIANLALLRGMVGRSGAGLLPLRGHSNVQGIGTIGVKPVLPATVNRQIEQTFSVKLPTTPGMDTMACMQAAHAGDVDAAVLMGGNLFDANPNRRWAEEALSNIPFRMSLTTTLNQSHVRGTDGAEVLVLPVTARDEEWEPTTQESMFNYVRLSEGGIRRLENVRPEVTVLADLAVRLLPDCELDFAAFKRHRKVREAIAAVVPGMEALKDIDEARREFHVARRLLHKPEFHTESGRASFRVCPTSVASQATDHFTLATVRSEGQFNTMIYEQNDTYRSTPHRWSVLMSPEDMAERRLKAGDRVDLVSEFGQMPGVSVYPLELPAGNLLAYYPEANRLTGCAVDPRSRTPAFKSTQVRVENVKGR